MDIMKTLELNFQSSLNH